MTELNQTAVFAAPAAARGLRAVGAGLAILYEAQAREDVTRGDLAPVLETFSAPFPALDLSYPHRRHASPALRALVDHLRRARRS